MKAKDNVSETSLGAAHDKCPGESWFGFLHLTCQLYALTEGLTG